MLTPSTFRMAKAHQDRLLKITSSFWFSGNAYTNQFKLQGIWTPMIHSVHGFLDEPEKSQSPTEQVHLHVR